MKFNKLIEIANRYPIIFVGIISFIIGFIIGYGAHEKFPEKFEPIFINENDFTNDVSK